MTTGALKMYFRELPEPLFTYAPFHDFVGAISESTSATVHQKGPDRSPSQIFMTRT